MIDQEKELCWELFNLLTIGLRLPFCASYKKHITLAFLSNNQIGIALRNTENHYPKYLLGFVEGLVLINEVCRDNFQIN